MQIFMPLWMTLNSALYTIEYVARSKWCKGEWPLLSGYR